MRRTIVLSSGGAAVVLGSLWYVLASPRSEGEYPHRAAATADLLRSQVQMREATAVMEELANGRLSNAIGTATLAVSVVVSLTAVPLLVLTRSGTS